MKGSLYVDVKDSYEDDGHVGKQIAESGSAYGGGHALVASRQLHMWSLKRESDD